METIEENRNLSEDEKLHRLKIAKGGTWYDGWKPYCMMCQKISKNDCQRFRI